MRLLRGVPYAPRPRVRPLELDLWLPDEPRGPLPVVVFVHGGGWRTGTRTEMGPAFRHWRPGPFSRLARAGFVVASLDYRLSGEAVHPAQLEDVIAGLVWLDERAGELGVDTTRTPWPGVSPPAPTSPPCSPSPARCAAASRGTGRPI
ncbi:alpha/beta hydrolase [Streptomyces gobitricini]|uniref:BD-FAE-like domain-containing protein n=1 Tax=Streptomyces gobitricini TaxID=68211 RepID=A0ABN3LWJ2_9ACTN